MPLCRIADLVVDIPYQYAYTAALTAGFHLPDGVFRAYGTPWCGKENIRVNASCPLAGLFFLERAAHNRAERLSAAAALPLLLGQIAMPADTMRAERVWALLDAFLRVVPVFRMHCNMEEEAAKVAFAAAAGE